jgi:cysteine-rich secretory family protein
MRRQPVPARSGKSRIDYLPFVQEGRVVRRESDRRIVRLAGAATLAVCAIFLQANLGRTSNVEERLLAAHNRARAEAGVPPLQWDEDLVQSASEWAANLAQLDDIEHYPDDPDDPDPEGENLWLGTRGHFAPEEMVGLWVAEKRNFQPGIFPANSRTGRLEDVGHYTQLVWRSTGRVGCAVAQGDAYDILVCRYREGGNVIGERPL